MLGQCPGCKKDISIFSVNKRFKCDNCSQSLVATNYTVAVISFFVTWISISTIAYLSGDLSAVFIDIFIAPIIAFFLFAFIIKIDVEAEKKDKISEKAGTNELSGLN